MFCEKCGRELEERWLGCPYCGMKISNNRSMYQSHSKIESRRCETERPERVRTNTQSRYAKRALQERKKRKRRNMIILLIFFLICIICVIIIKNMNSGKTVDEQENINMNYSNFDNVSENEFDNIKENMMSLSLQTDIIRDEYGHEYLNRLIPGTYWEQNYGVNVYCDISILNGEYCMSLLADAASESMKGYFDNTIILKTMPLDISMVTQNGKAILYGDSGEELAYFSSCDEGGRLQGILTEAGRDYISVKCKWYGDIVCDILDGILCKLILDAENTEVSAIYEEPAVRNELVLCQKPDGTYSGYKEDYNGDKIFVDYYIEGDVYGNRYVNLNIQTPNYETVSVFENALLDVSEVYRTGEMKIIDEASKNVIGYLYNSVSGIYVEFTVDEINGYSSDVLCGDFKK